MCWRRTRRRAPTRRVHSASSGRTAAMPTLPRGSWPLRARVRALVCVCVCVCVCVRACVRVRQLTCHATHAPAHIGLSVVVRTRLIVHTTRHRQYEGACARAVFPLQCTLPRLPLRTPARPQGLPRHTQRPKAPLSSAHCTGHSTTKHIATFMSIHLSGSIGKRTATAAPSTVEPPRAVDHATRGRSGAGRARRCLGVARRQLSRRGVARWAHSTRSVSRIQIKAPGLLSRNSRMSEPAMRKTLPSLSAWNVSRCGLRCSRE